MLCRLSLYYVSKTKTLARISHTASAASCRLRRPAGCSASRLSPLRSGCCGPPPLRSGPNFPWTVCSHTVRREPPGGKSGPRVDARGTLRATLRVVCLRLTSLCSVYLRYAPIRSGCGHGSSLRLATKRYEKSGLDAANHLCIRSRSGSPYFPRVGKNSMRTVVGGGFSLLLQNVSDQATARSGL
jgi:hypothetical protein